MPDLSWIYWCPANHQDPSWYFLHIVANLQRSVQRNWKIRRKYCKLQIAYNAFDSSLVNSIVDRKHVARETIPTKAMNAWRLEFISISISSQRKWQTKLPHASRSVARYSLAKTLILLWWSLILISWFHLLIRAYRSLSIRWRTLWNFLSTWSQKVTGSPRHKGSSKQCHEGARGFRD